MAYKHNGKTLQMDRGFTLGDTQYPSNWLRLSTEADRTALGITWEDDPVRADDTYYQNGDINTPHPLDDVLAVDEDGQPIYVQEWDANAVTADNSLGASVNKQPLEQAKSSGLKSRMTAKVKETAGNILANTDWYVVRKMERNVDMPLDVAEERSHVRTECDRLEAAINAVTTVEELITVMNSQNWNIE